MIQNILNIKELKNIDCSNKVAVFDLDGTLVNVDSIRYLVETTSPNYNEFHLRSVDCPPFYDVLKLLKQFHDLHIKVILVTGRQEKYRKLTDFWLATHNITIDELIMRPERFSGSKLQFKELIFRNIIKAYEVIAVFDDDEDLLNLWRQISPTKLVKCPELTILPPQI